MWIDSIKQHWQISILVLIMLPILLKLGFWQLDRAEEKQRLLAVYQQQRELPAVALATLNSADDPLYRSVILKGRFDEQRYWLLDNQTRNSKLGYEVVMPFITAQKTVLVNRGWVAAPFERNQLPVIETPHDVIEITGYLYGATTNAIVKNSSSDLTAEWPKRVVHLPTEQAAKEIDVELFPLWVRLHEESPGAFVTDWIIANVNPEKHFGYAVQWFAMALTLTGLYLILLLRGIKNRLDEEPQPLEHVQSQ